MMVKSVLKIRDEEKEKVEKLEITFCARADSK